ncbi:uncharacterized protein PG986_013936 [Apiospora aurea]|uniref:DUF924 domain-containing protein n=1 Tax=Apiospora aurea TaxID=335848 RepID=A0ABR1PX02_9PEZI
MSAANGNPDVQRVLAFWFDRPPIEWIIAFDGLDHQLKTEFGDLVQKARRNELDDWATASPESSVALVLGRENTEAEEEFLRVYKPSLK